MSPKRAIALVNRHRGGKIDSSSAIKTETKESQTTITKSGNKTFCFNSHLLKFYKNSTYRGSFTTCR